MNNRQKFKQFCEKEKSLPVFLSYNWLEAVAPKNWDVAIEERGEKIVGVLPYIIHKKKGLKYIELPVFTPLGGVWINYPEGQKYVSKLAYEKEVYTNLINQLPPFDSFVQKFHPTITNWLPFYWKGFSQSTYYTYVLTDLSDKDKIFNEFKDDVRRNIRKTAETIEVTSSQDIDILLKLKIKSYRHKGMKMNFHPDLLKRIFKFCIENNCGELLIAMEGNHIHSATLFVWDNQTCYNLITATDPEFKNSDSVSLIIWMAIQRYSGKVREFNFEGSMIQGVESFFRSFGAKQIPYFVIKKTNSRILKIKEFISSII